MTNGEMAAWRVRLNDISTLILNLSMEEADV